MKAALLYRYGAPELRETDMPAVADNEVLVRVRASSVNAADWYGMMGRPAIMRAQAGMRRPKDNRLGTDFAGEVEAVGKDVTHFRPGDEVFGARTGAYAEYVSVPEDRAIVPKPGTVTFEEAAAVPVAGLTALQGLRDKAHVQPGQHVLINGASGGVGTFAVQIAKALGAEVTAVCSTGNVERARSLGADHVVDYTQEDFTRADRRYDVLFDVAGSRSWSECVRILEPQATLVVVGAPKAGRLLGPLRHIAAVRLASVRSSQTAAFFIAKVTKADMAALAELLETGTITAAIDKRYELSEIAEAFRYFGEGHARAKVVVTV
jgi:NADPH:quinone reductase-like Zn-dependent oxidoreductase